MDKPKFKIGDKVTINAEGLKELFDKQMNVETILEVHNGETLHSRLTHSPFYYITDRRKDGIWEQYIELVGSASSGMLPTED